MEDKEGISPSGVTVKGNEAPDSYHVAPRTENPSSSPFPGPTMAATAAPPVSVAMAVTGTGSKMKKKRGRPRKYGPDGTVSTALSPMPISSSIPLSGEFSAWKRGRGRPVDSVKKSHKFEFETSGDRIAYFVGANFTPHVITVNAGEDVTMKIMSFSQQGSRAICILSANGTISNVTLRQPTSSGGTLTYESQSVRKVLETEEYVPSYSIAYFQYGEEHARSNLSKSAIEEIAALKDIALNMHYKDYCRGRFEILSLSGSFMPTENGGTKSRSGGMSVSLAGPDGRVLGGGLAGLLVAAGPVQVVVGSFLPGHQQEQKHKKQKTEPAPVITPANINAIPTEEMKVTYSQIKPILTHSSSFHGDNSASLNPIQGFRNSIVDNNKESSTGEESKGTSHSNCDVSS